ncbi:MAG: AAA family ATPase [Candidatus Eremiobacteraeota bacterium]|nr:AAA family ATPase [Candidatus Eremiobacteraeota bacterium]
MSRTLLPSRSEIGAFAPIERPRLVERLASSAACPIVLMIAPAGYGKSVVLRQYLETLREPHVCFALRPDHSTLLGFLRGLTQTLGKHAPHSNAALAGAYERNTASPKRAVDLARWMHAHLESFCGVVAIDDLHLADTDPEVARFLAALIDRTKDKIRWVIASRSTTGLPVGTWLAYRDAEMPVDEHDLRFTLEEAREAALCLGLTIADAELEELLTLTEGWPAAMSFALRTSRRSADLRGVSALTREMIYRLLAEQVHETLDVEERALLEIAAALPAIDIGVLEKAGFDRALTIVERLRERTAFLYEESPGVYQCHDLFREFLRHQMALSGRRYQQMVCERAARALEASGDVEHAIAAFVAAALQIDVTRLLEAHGFDLLERARSDVVSRAIESLDEKSHRENATILALQGALQAIAGKFARAESLFRRALARAGDDRDLVANASLRLASLMANQGRDVSQILAGVGDNPRQSAAHRAEALALLAAQRAVAGDEAAALSAIVQVEASITAIQSDSVRARVLQRIGIAFHHLGLADRAFEALSHSNELASDLHQYGLASKANAVLSNLAFHENDDIDAQLHYAEAAAEAARRAGDAFASQTALLQILSVRMRQADVRKCLEIEKDLGVFRKSDLVMRYLALFRALRVAWEGRFGEAHHLLSSCWTHLTFDFDKIVAGSEYALFLALDEQTQLSTSIAKETRGMLDTATVTGIFRTRALAVAKLLCALTEAINGRTSYADRLLRLARSNCDAVIEAAANAVDLIIIRLRHQSAGGFGVREALERLEESGYTDLSRLLGAVDRTLMLRQMKLLGQNRLTRSEIEILRLLCQGYIPKDIATRTGRSVFTVRVHIANVIGKLGCHGRAEAIRAAQGMGLL